MKTHNLYGNFYISPQVHPRQIPALVESGYTTLINFRPDDEVWGQPKNSRIEEAAKAAGLNYVFIPVSMREGISPEQIEQTKKAQDKYDGKILAFCRSGTRAAFLWALSQKDKLAADEIISSGSRAGIDLRPLQPALRT